MNHCQDCIQKQNNSLPSECPECGAETLYGELDGRCICLKCLNCGYEIVGASIFPQCSLDDRKYTVSISAAEKSQYLRIAKVFGLNTVQLREYLNKGNSVTRSDLSLDEAARMIQQLQEVGLPFQVEPNPLDEFSELLSCTYR